MTLGNPRTFTRQESTSAKVSKKEIFKINKNSSYKIVNYLKLQNSKINYQKSSDELDEFARAKLERDLLDLQRLIGAHFEERAKDEECLVDLKDRITERKEMREAQIKERARKQQERDMIKKMEKEKKENEEEERRLAEEHKVCINLRVL